MKKNLTIIIVMFIIVSLMASCSHDDTHNDHHGGIEVKNGCIKVSDLNTCSEWIGQTDESLGLDKLTDISADIEGKLFGKNCSGNIHFSKDDRGERCVDRLYLIIKDHDLSFKDCYDKLCDQYSGPISSGTEPYVKSNGGAVDWYVFDMGDTTVKISMGQENNYYTYEVCKNECPGSVKATKLCDDGKGHHSEGHHNDHHSEKNSCYARIISYDNGKLCIEITNNTGKQVSFDKDFKLSIYKEDGYYSMDEKCHFVDTDSHITIDDGKSVTFECDLRNFGKVVCADYLLKIGECELFFTLE